MEKTKQSPTVYARRMARNNDVSTHSVSVAHTFDVVALHSSELGSEFGEKSASSGHKAFDVRH